MTQGQMTITPPKSTVKDSIILLLSEKFPLTVKQIHALLKKNFQSESSYQAVHKILTHLGKEHIALKEKTTWKLNPLWLQKQETFFQQTLQKYGGNQNKYDIDLHFDGTQVFHFDRFTDLCVETAKLLSSRKLQPNKEPFYCVFEYGWWPFKFQFEHLELLYRMVKNCPNSRHIIRKNTPFGEWIGKQYRRVGGIGAPIGTSVNISNDIFIQGDYIIEIRISPEGKKTIEKYWNKWKNLNDQFKDFGVKPEPTIHATVQITKNPSLAKFFKNELEKYFN